MLSKAKLIDELQFILSQSESLCTITCPTADGYRMGAEDVFNHLQMLGVLKIDAAEGSTQPPLPQAAVSGSLPSSSYGQKLINAIQTLDDLGAWEEWKNNNPGLLKKLQKLIKEHEAEKKKALEKMQTNKHNPEMYAWYEAWGHSQSLFLKSLAKLERLAADNGT